MGKMILEGKFVT